MYLTREQIFRKRGFEHGKGSNVMKGKFESLVSQETPVLVDFYADWCGPCQAMAPVLKEVAKAHEGKVKVIKIDVDKNQPLAQKFGVRSIPTFILFKNGEMIWRKGGIMTSRELSNLILKEA